MGRKCGGGGVFCDVHGRLRDVERLHLRHVDFVRPQSQAMAQRTDLQRGGRNGV